MRGLQATGMVDEHPRSGRPHKTTPRGDMVIVRFTRIIVLLHQFVFEMN